MVYPFLVKIDVKFNVLRLKGVFTLTLFNKLKFTFKLRIKHGYVYIYLNNKEIKAQITKRNFSFVFIVNLIKHLYFREQFLILGVNSQFGYVLDSRITAVTSGYMDVLFKGIFCKIKNNKLSSHIFVNVEPKYNEDIFNFRLTNIVRVSVVDLIYSVIVALFYAWRDYVKDKKSILVKN